MSVWQNQAETKALRKFRIAFVCYKWFLKAPNTAKRHLCEIRTVVNMLEKWIRKPSKKKRSPA